MTSICKHPDTPRLDNDSTRKCCNQHHLTEQDIAAYAEMHYHTD